MVRRGKAGFSSDRRALSNLEALALLVGMAVAACDTFKGSTPPPEPRPSQGGAGGSGGLGGRGTNGGTGARIVIPPVVAAPCGNGVLDDGEECDDGNHLNGDACSDDCHLEPGVPCPIPDRCSHGNGQLDGAEQCDDGNHESMDGCLEGKVVRGWFCPTPGKPCRAVCGDGIVSGDEQCDDGPRNLGAYGGCRADCSWASSCGDGVVDTPMEECDDGMNVTVYGRALCAPGCGEPACGPGCVFPPFCGDGIVDAANGEECDSGTSIGGPCDRSCRLYVGP